MTSELLINVLARSALGLLSATVLSFFVWRATEASFDVREFSLGWFFLVQASIVGAAATIPTAFAWWNTQSRRRILLASFFLILVTAVISAWLVNEVRGIETHYALFRGVKRVPVFSLTHMFVSLMFGAVLGANAAGAAFYLYRSLRHREV